MQKGHREMFPILGYLFGDGLTSLFSLIIQDLEALFLLFFKGKLTWATVLMLNTHFLPMSLGPMDACHDDGFSFENQVFTFISIKSVFPLLMHPAVYSSSSLEAILPHHP